MGGPQHGYGLMTVYRDCSGIEVNSGSVYRELQSLERRGLVELVDNPSDADPRRATYAITDAGRAAFDAWLSDPGNPGSESHEDDLSARALFIADAEPECVNRMFDHWKEELWIHGKRLERDREASLKQSKNGGFAPRPVLLARRLKRVAADLEFVEDLRSAYEESQRGPQAGSPPKGSPPRRRS